MPDIVLENNKQNREQDLDSYVNDYLEEEIRAEAAVRNVGNFAQFLKLAASESGVITNFAKLSQDIGVTADTIRSYYQILEDCLVTERIDPYLTSKTRRRLTKTSECLFFDLGIRRISAYEGTLLPESQLGRLFEQFVGLELIRNSRLLNERIKIYFWRDNAGPEIDWLIEHNNQLTAIEVKLTAAPTEKDAKYLKIFLKEHPNCKQAYIVCQTPRAFKVNERITAIPWQNIPNLLGIDTQQITQH